jgi:hypothetical protein
MIANYGNSFILESSRMPSLIKITRKIIIFKYLIIIIIILVLVLAVVIISKEVGEE